MEINQNHKYKQNKAGMKKSFKFLFLFLFFAVSLSLQLSKTALAAGSASLSLTPSSGSYKKDTILTVTIYENSGSVAINAVEADLQYDTTKLQYDSINTSASAFDLAGPSTYGGGLVKIPRAKSGSTLIGSQIVASVSFKALVGSGTTPITFASSSGIIEPTAGGPQNVWNGSPTGGTYTLTGTTTTTTTKKTTTTTTTTTTKKVTTTQTTNSSKTSTTKKKAAPRISAVTNSYNVAVKVTGNNGKAVKGALVTLDGQLPLAYDAGGTASFSNITAGEHTVKVSADGISTSKVITVAAGSPNSVQEFDVRLNIGKSLGQQMLMAAGIIALLILIVGGGTGLMKFIRKAKLGSDLSSHFPSTNSPGPASTLPIKEPSKVQVGGAISNNNATVIQATEPKPDGANINNNSRSWNDQKAHNG